MKFRWLIHPAILATIILAAADSAQAAATVDISANASISVQTARIGGTGAFTTLTGPIIRETDPAGMPVGSMVLNAPAGFEFDVTANGVTITATPVNGNEAKLNASQVTATTNTITVSVTTASKSSNRTVFTWSGIKVRPINTTLPAGTITYSGTSTGLGNGTVMGTLTTTPGTATTLTFSQQPANSVYGALLSPQPVVVSRDTFGNPSTIGLGTSKSVTIALTAGTGALLGTASLDIGTSAGNGTVTFSGLSLSAAGSGKQLTASAPGLPPALSDTFTITPATVNPSITADHKIYDGTTAATIASPTLSGVIGTDDAALTGGTATFADKHAADGKDVTATGLSLTGADAANYQLTTTSAATTANITQRPLTVTAVIDTKVFDGNTSSTGIPTITGSLAAGDTASWIQTFDSASVGAGKTLTPSGNITDGNGGNNYDLTLVSVNTGTITPSGVSVLTVTATATSKTYDGTDAAAVTLSDDRQLDDDITVTYTAATFADRHAAENKNVTVSGLAITGRDAGDYVLAAPTADTTATITPRPLTVTATSDSKAYDGTTTSTALPTLTSGSLVGTDSVTWSQAFASHLASTGITLSPAGTVADGNGGANYAVTFVNNTGDITPVSLTPSITADNKTYDGTTAATIATRSLSGVIGADVVSLTDGTAIFDNKTAANGKTVTATGLSLSGTDAGNYQLASTSASTTADITAKGLTVTGVTAGNKIYDGNLATTINATGASLVGKVIGDTVTVDATLATGHFATKDVGTGKPVTISGLALAGADAGNYTLTQPSASANITVRPIQVAGTRVYDRTYEAASTILTIANNVDGADLALTGSVTLANRSVGTQPASVRTLDRVQSRSGNNSGTSSVALTLSTAPTSGNTLIAVISTRGSTANLVSSISQTGATWSRVAQSFNASGATTEIWYAPNVISAGTSLTINLAASLRAAAVVMEYRGVLAADAADRIADATGSGTAASTGTAPTSSQADELWIGAIGHQNDDRSLSTPTGGFTLVASAATTDGNPANRNIKVHALENLVTATGQAVSGGILTGSEVWAGAIATFRATPTALTGAAAGNYTLTGLTGSVTISAQPLTASGITANNKPYDGTAVATLNTGEATLTGVLTGDAVTLSTASATGTFDSDQVGNGRTVTVAGLALLGDDDANYGITPPTTTANITTRTLTVGATAQHKPYDSTTAAAVTLGDNRVGGDDLTLTHSSATFATKQAGIGKTVTVNGIALSGPDAANYQLASTSATTTATITPITLTVSATGSNKIYDGTTAATVSLADNRLTGDSFTPAYAAAAFVDKLVGTGKAITVTGINITGADADNYVANATASANANITPRNLTVTATGQNRPYDGTINASVTLSDDRVGSDNLTAAYSAATFDTADADIGKTVTVSGINISGPDAPNYALTATAATTTATITPIALTVTGIAATDKIYDGNANASVSGTPAASGLIGGDTVTIDGSPTAAFATAAVGIGKTVSVSGYSLGGPQAGNYTLTQPTLLAADITPATVTGHITADNKSYDGTTAATIATRSLTGVIGADNVTLTGGTATFADKAATNGKTVTATGLSLSGTDAGNYQLATDPITTAADITPAVLTVSAAAASRAYGAANPAFTPSYTGFVGGETFATSGVGGTPDFTCAANASSPVAGNPYAISGAPGSLTAQNYTFAFTDGTLFVTKAELTVTADNASRVYGAPNPVFTASITGFVNDETLGTSGVTGAPGLTTTATAASTVLGSPYPITAAIGSLVASNYAFSFAPGALTITKADSTVAVTSAVNPSVFGQSVTFTATVAAVAPGAGTRTGMVQFQIDGVNHGAPVALFGGTALSSAIASLSVGPHTITAVYGGSSNFNGSTSPSLTQTVNPGATTTAVTSPKTPTVYGETVTFTATVSPVIPGATPTGLAQFKINGINSGTPVALTGGVATFIPTLGTLPVGSHNVTAVYAGDGVYSPSTSPVRTQVVSKAATTAMLTSDTPTVYSQTATFTATVTATAPGGGIPTGTVRFYDNRPGNLMGTATLDAFGVATMVTYALTSKTYPKAHVEYLGDDNFLPVTSDDTTHRVNKASTTTGVSSSVNPSIYGQPVTFTASVTVVAPGTAIPDGTVTFAIDGLAQSAVTLDATGQAQWTTAAISVGTHGVTATYGGSGNFSASGGTLAGGQTVTTAASGTAISTEPNPAVYGQPVTLVATVAPTGPSTAIPSGSVVFDVDGVPQSPASLDAAGEARLVFTGILDVGAHTINASYSGDIEFEPSIATAFDLTVGPATLTGIVTIADKQYDGTTTATIAGHALSGIVGTDDIQLIGGTATFNTKDAGTDKTVTTVDLALTGAALARYLLDPTPVLSLGNILPVALTVTPDNTSRAYGQANPSFTATITGFIPGEELLNSGVAGTPDLTSPATPTSPLGNYSIVGAPGNLTAQNYSFSFTEGILTIVPGPYAALLPLTPGETLAPFTPSGKTGTPTFQVVGVPFDLTVLATDAGWTPLNNIIETMSITSPDPLSTMPPATPLIAGTGLFPVTFGTPGTWTVTVTSVDDPAKEATSTPILVIPLPPTHLGFTVQPLDGTAGQTLAAVTVQVQDAEGRAVPLAGTAITLDLAVGEIFAGTLTRQTGPDGSATFDDIVIRRAGTALMLTGEAGGLVSALSAPFRVWPGTPTNLRVETQPDGSGQVVPPRKIWHRAKLRVYAISRDDYDNFIANIPADLWMLLNITGDVRPEDLVPDPDNRSAVFHADHPGTAEIHAESAGLSSDSSGIIQALPLNRGTVFRIQ